MAVGFRFRRKSEDGFRVVEGHAGGLGHRKLAYRQGSLPRARQRQMDAIRRQAGQRILPVCIAGHSNAACESGHPHRLRPERNFPVIPGLKKLAVLSCTTTVGLRASSPDIQSLGRKAGYLSSAVARSQWQFSVRDDTFGHFAGRQKADSKGCALVV